ncbi:MAG: GNAT family acetyltransferase [Verrucomicrobiia bacterium]
MTEPPSIAIRPYLPSDRAAVRAICADTGFLGNPVDPIFQDRETFADFLTSYYTDAEPETSVVLTDHDRVVGYILASRFPRRARAYWLRRGPALALRVLLRYLFHYQAPSRRYIRWLLWRGWRETPYTPPGIPHFHINLLPPYRNVAQTRALIDFFLARLARTGETKVYGQMVTFHNRRGTRMFARYGFEVIDTKEVSKFRNYVNHPVFLFTVLKDLTQRVTLYAEAPPPSSHPPAS